jgi:hypothetical protein
MSARTDPYPNFRFLVEIESLLTTGFNEVRGLSLAIDESDEGAAATDAPAWRQILERDMSWGRTWATATRATDSPTLKLRRGVTDDSALWSWYRDWIDGLAEPADARIVLLDETGRESRGWRCKQARPVRWSGPTLSADDPDVAMETFELAHDGIERLELNG